MAAIIYAGDAGVFKTCIRCNETKPLTCFSVSPTNSGGVGSRCKPCVAAYSKQHYAENRDRVRSQQNAAYHTDGGRDKSRQRMARWRAINPEKARAAGRASARKARSTPSGRLNEIMSAAILRSLRAGKNGQRWEALVGYTVGDLMRHLERQFLPGMSWANYGRGGWHIDHKIPKSAFNFDSAENHDFKRCWALENLQPLWEPDNIRKRNRLEAPFQPSLAF